MNINVRAFTAWLRANDITWRDLSDFDRVRVWRFWLHDQTEQKK